MTVASQNRDIYYDRDDTLISYIIPFTFDEFYQVRVSWGTGRGTPGYLVWHELTQDVDYNITKDMTGGTITLLDPASLADESGYPFTVLNIKSDYLYQSMTPHQTNYSQSNNENISDNHEIQTQQISSHIDYIDDLLENDIVQIMEPNEAGRLVKVYESGDNNLVGTTITEYDGDIIRIGNHVNIQFTLTVQGHTSTYSLHVVQNTTMGGTLAVTGAVTFYSNLDVKGHTTLTSATLSGNLIVQGASDLQDVTAKTITTTGDVIVGSNLTVNLNSLFKGNSQIQGTLGVTGHTNVSTLTASGAILCEIMTTTGNANVGSNLFVSGNAEVVGSLTVRGAISAGETTVTGLTVNGNTKLNGSADIAGPVSIHGYTRVDGDLSIGGTVTGVDANFQDIVAESVTSGTIEAVDLLTTGPLIKLNNDIKLIPDLTYSSTLLNLQLAEEDPDTNTYRLVNRELTTGGGGGSGSINVNLNYVAIGDGEAGLTSGKLRQVDQLSTYTTPYALETYLSVRLRSQFNSGFVQLSHSNITNTKRGFVIDTTGFEKMKIGSVAPWWCTKFSQTEGNLHLAYELSPGMALNEPYIDHALSEWDGHESAYENKDLNANPIVKLEGNRLSFAKFTDEVLITSHSKYVEALEVEANVITLDTTSACCFTCPVSTSTTIELAPDLFIGNGIVLFIARVATEGTISWPSTWRWPQGAAPISTSWAINSINVITIRKVTNGYNARRILGGGNADIDTSSVIVLGEHRDYAPLNYFDTFGNKLEVVQIGSITDNTINGLVFACQINNDVRFSYTRNVVVSNNVLSITFGKTTERVVYFTHDFDINVINITFDTQTIPVNIVFSFSIVLLPGLSAQTKIPIPTGVLVTDGANSDGLINVGTKGAVMNFVKWPDNSIFYLEGVKSDV